MWPGVPLSATWQSKARWRPERDTLMAVSPFTCFAPQFNSTGALLSGGSVTVYLAGTTTLISLFSNTALSITAANPIILDSAGRHGMVYFATAAYKILLKNSAGVTIATFDDIDPGIAIGTGDVAIADGGTGASTAGAALSNLGGATAAELADVAAEVAALSGTLASTEKTHIATGTTAQRPAIPIEGDIRRNTTTSRYEGYTSSWENFVTSATLKADIQALTGPFTVQYLTSGTGATYTRPTDCTAIRVRMVGGGGGGGAVSANAGSAGGTTIFNSINANGGNGGGIQFQAGGAGGNGGSGSASLRINGSAGQAAQNGADASVAGSTGASGIFGMGAGVGAVGGTGGNAAANTGAGGAGGGGTNTGAGGGGGEYVEILITSPSATYTYTVGAGGNGGAAGGVAGGNGGSGLIIVDEFYQ